MTEWKDISTYSQGDKKRIPCNYEYKTDEIRIRVHRHKDYPEKWCLSCYDLNINNMELGCKDIKTAKKEAIMRIKKRLEYMLRSLKD